MLRASAMAVVAFVAWVGLTFQARGEFILGFNQAWFKNAYGWSLTGGFDLREVKRIFQFTKRAGGSVLRLWLFEGDNPQGVLWDKAQQVTPAPSDRTRTCPTGLSDQFLTNLHQVLVAAKESGVLVYVTLFDGNVPHPETAKRYAGKEGSALSYAEKRYAEHWNLLNDKYGVGRCFREGVLRPVLSELARHAGSVFALDLVNEINARTLPKESTFQGGWEGARKFVGTWSQFAKALWPGLRLTASVGNSCALQDLLPRQRGLNQSWCPRGGRRLSGLKLDFYDLHLYNDRGEIPYCGALSALSRADRVPILLGELGQASPAYDDALQKGALGKFVQNARRCGLWGALAWRLSDIRPGQNPEARFSFEANGQDRPAVQTMQSLASDPKVTQATPSRPPPAGLAGEGRCPAGP